MNYNITSSSDFISTIKLLCPGDIINLSNIVYLFDSTLEIYTSNITINGNSAILDFRHAQYSTGGLITYGNNISISNLTIQFSGYKGFFHHGSNSIFDSITSEYNCNTGIQMKYGGGNIIKNCVARYNFDYKCEKCRGLRPGFSADGFSDKQHSGLPNSYLNCVSYGNSDDGFDFYERSQLQFTTLTNCVAYNNGFPNDTIILERGDYDLINHSCGNGTGFKLGGNQKRNNIRLCNCNAYNNKQCPYSSNHNAGKIILENCTKIAPEN